MSKLVADIGGTNARFALVDGTGELSDIRNLPTSGYPGPAAAVRAYLGAREVDTLVMAVATPVAGDRIRFTNCNWEFLVPELQAELGLERLSVINDFVAQALAVPQLSSKYLDPVRDGTVEPGWPMAVMGPGTGLGVAALVPVGGGWRPLASEGGHASFAPQNAREDAILRELRRQWPHVSCERVVSGPGLLHVARSLAAIDGKELQALSPESVTQFARERSCEICMETVEVFSGLIGSMAGDLALTFGARGGVYLCGGVTARLGELLDHDRLTTAFLEKGRLRSFLEPVPVAIVTHPNPGLLGTAHYHPDL
ncbi:MAG: glucokinase [Geminicoccaceae bacterium]|nr:glucokinase [Geminicoccaceae bacterium]